MSLFNAPSAAEVSSSRPFDFSFGQPATMTNDRHDEDHQHHMALLGISEVSSADHGGVASRLEEIRNAPMFTLGVKTAIQTQRVDVGQREVPNHDVFPQYGMIGHREPPSAGLPEDKKFKADRDIIYANMNAPWSAFICGSQGAGKSHTFSCLLENSLLSPNAAGVLPDPLTGVVFHYDRFTSHSSTQLCEAAYLCSVGVPVQVLVSPSNIHAMQTLYHNLPGLPADAPKPQVRALKLHENHLNVGNMKTLMNVDAGSGKTPLYLAVLDKILREMAKERGGRPGFSYADFKDRLRSAGFTRMQLGPLGLRLQLLEEFLDQSRTSSSYETVFNNGKGSLTIVDLSCPFVDENAACALFSICLSLFLERRNSGGRIIGLDEAHKFLTQSGEAANFTEQLISIIRQQRHLASRVIVSTQEPTLSPQLLELCNVAFVHRFRSPRWLDALKDHIAGAAKLRKAGEGSPDEMFKTVVALRTGEAIVFSPDSVLDVVNASIGIWDTEMALESLADKFVKVRIRNRISTDGGKSIMASDKIEQLGFDSHLTAEPRLVSNMPALGSHQVYSFVDLTGDTSGEEEEQPPTVAKRIQPLRQAKRESTSSARPYTPRAQSFAQTQSPAPFSNPPRGHAVLFPEPTRQPAAAPDIERGLVRHTEDMLAYNSTVLDFGKVRRRVEDELGIIPGALTADGWTPCSKKMIKKAALAWFKNKGKPRPKFTQKW